MCDQDAYYTEAMFDIDNATEEKVGAKECMNQDAPHTILDLDSPEIK